MTTECPRPPPPPTYGTVKTRPSAVIRYAVRATPMSILVIVIAVLDIYYLPPVGYITGGAYIFTAVYSLICAVGLLASQRWALTLAGVRNRDWDRTREAAAYFGLPAVQPLPSQPPPTPTCPTCEQILTYVPQRQRW